MYGNSAVFFGFDLVQLMGRFPYTIKNEEARSYYMLKKHRAKKHTKNKTNKYSEAWVPTYVCKGMQVGMYVGMLGDTYVRPKIAVDTKQKALPVQDRCRLNILLQSSLQYGQLLTKVDYKIHNILFSVRNFMVARFATSRLFLQL